MVETIVLEAGHARLWRERECHDRHVIDAAADDQRLGDSGWNTIIVGADFLMHPKNGVVRRSSNEEPRRDNNPVIDGI